MRRGLALVFLVAAAACVRGQNPTVPTPPSGRSPAPTTSLAGAGPAWQTLAPTPTARTEVTAAVTGKRIFVVGGFDAGGDTVRTVEVYDIESNLWLEGPRLPLAVNHAMAASAGESIYVFGGYRGPGLAIPSDRAFVFVPSTSCPKSQVCGEWREPAKMPEPRAAAGAAAASGRIYIAGGVGPRGLAQSMLAFDPNGAAGGKWSALSGPPTAREHLGVASDGKKVFVVGGRTSGIGSNLAAAEVFDPATGGWMKLPDMPTARGGIAAGFAARFVGAAGGEAAATFNDAEALDIGSLAWLRLPAMPTARHGLAVVGAGNVIYVIAGGTRPGLTVSAANEAIDLGPLVQ